MTYLDGLKAAEAACHAVRQRSLKDRREAMAEGDIESQSYAAAEALACWLCIEAIHALIDVAIAKGEPP